MYLYKKLSSLPFNISYVSKLMVITFIGIHVPLISLYVFVLVKSGMENSYQFLLTALIATLSGTFVTLLVIHRMLDPVKRTAEALENFRTKREVSNLPKEYKDEVGVLMGQTQESIENLDSLLKYKNNLLSIISHDTKTPIGSIKMCSEMIDSLLKEEEINRKELNLYNSLIKQSNNNQLEIINNIISIAVFDEKKYSLDIENVSISTLIEEIESSFQLYFEKKNMKFGSSFDSSLDEIRIDRLKVLGILKNLIQNAIKFTPKGGKIDLEITKNTENYLVFVIRDTGMGIPEDKLENLFIAFSLSSKGTEQEKGKGLGLWIVKMFTEMHNGKVEVKSKEGEGSEFTVYIQEQD